MTGIDDQTRATAQQVIDRLIEQSQPFFEEVNTAAARDIIAYGRVTEETMRMEREAFKQWMASVEGERE